jgi:hypothetical protein
VATVDGAGGATPDTVTVRIPGLPAAGEAQCATWAGDGSHRMPMMAFANQVPAFDAVRITVRGAGAADTNEPSEDAPAPAVEADEPAEAEDAAAEQAGTAEQTDATPTPEVGEETAAPRSAETVDADAGSQDDRDTGTDD